MKPVTPAEAKEVWDSLEKPSLRKVADKFKAAGRPISFKQIGTWKNAGWPARSAEQIEAQAAVAVEKMDTAAPALTGNVMTVLADVVQAKAEAKADEPDTRSNAARAEDALLKAITGATTVWESIRDLATMRPEGVDKNAPPLMLLAQPEGIAKLMVAASQAISQAIEDFKQIPALRMETADAVTGTQTVYAPGQGPHAAADYPLRSAMESFDAALKAIRERKA